MADNSLPTFLNPPVVETVLGVQFDPISGFSNAHLGAFWKWLLVDDKYPSSETWNRLSDAAPIDSAFERFDNEQSWSDAAVRIGSFPPARLQIRNDARDAMIQLQNTRLLYNWIGQAGKNYSRYQQVRPRFDLVYEAFRDFLREERLGEPKENQWEVTYVNHIPKGTVWNTPDDWRRLFKLPEPWAASTEVVFESMAGSWHFEIPPQRGRLHIDIKHAKIVGRESEGLLRLTLTARGPIETGQTSLSDGLDLGRRTIVFTFKDITSAEAHKEWKLQP